MEDPHNDIMETYIMRILTSILGTVSEMRWTAACARDVREGETHHSNVKYLVPVLATTHENRPTACRTHPLAVIVLAHAASCCWTAAQSNLIWVNWAAIMISKVVRVKVIDAATTRR